MAARPDKARAAEARLADGAHAHAGAPGRTCPPSYGYSPRALARPADVSADVLYVIGGLYGNALALDAIEGMAEQETVEAALVFNGDFHWFDAEPAAFAAIQQRVLVHHALRGNVETEIASDDAAAGCGCAYPESVPDEDVARSNAILERLRSVAAQVAGSRTALGALPMHAVAQVGGARIGIVHGDAWSLAGWRFAHDRLHGTPDDALEAALALAAVDGFASSHTCAPALKTTERGFVINNGAAGMANFRGTTYGVITRIATRALPAALEPHRLYGLNDWIGGRPCLVDALKVEFDHAAWLRRFDACWADGTAAALSYRRRILEGCDFGIDQALGRAVMSCTG
jgi:hypothetical protein